ncbi:MAG TPA: PEGA domain-containing protein, partial [Polyangiales bacterium]|nr:PEGA domain-containing protein [Polyangiales bacterium]
KNRPMFVAVAAVIAIVGSIVLGLLVFGQREPGTVHLVTVPGRVSVKVDGRALGVSTSPFVIGELSAGKRHDIEVSSAGFRPWSSSVELQPGQVLALPEVHLEAIETGFTLASQPIGATVFIDGRQLAQATPLRVIDLQPGDHRIRVEHEGYAPWESGLHATTGTVLPLQAVNLQPLAAAEAAPPPSAAHAPAYAQTWRRHAGSDSEGTGRSSSDSESSAPSMSAATKAPPPEPAPEPEHAEPSESAPSSGGTGTLRVNTRPWSQVFVDGKAFGTTPRMNITIEAGSHTLTLVNDEFSIRKTVEVTVQAGKVETVVLNLAE